MKCCKENMTVLYCWDDSQLTDHAYNLYACEKCGKIIKEDV